MKKINLVLVLIVLCLVEFKSTSYAYTNVPDSKLKINGVECEYRVYKINSKEYINYEKLRLSLEQASIDMDNIELKKGKAYDNLENTYISSIILRKEYCVDANEIAKSLNLEFVYNKEEKNYEMNSKTSSKEDDENTESEIKDKEELENETDTENNIDKEEVIGELEQKIILNEFIPFDIYNGRSKAIDETKETSFKYMHYCPHLEIFNIRATSKMGDIEYKVEGDKLSIVVSNATVGKGNSNIELENNIYIKQAEMLQLEDKVEIKIKLNEGVIPSQIKVYDSREQMDIIFGADILKSVAFGEVEYNKEACDYISLDANYSDIAVRNIKDKIVIDLENTINPFFNNGGNGWYKAYDDVYAGKIIENYTITQFNESTSRIVLETKQEVETKIIENELGAIVIFIPKDKKIVKENKWVELEKIPLEGSDILEGEDYTITYDYIKKSALVKFDNKEVYINKPHIYEIKVEYIEENVVFMGIRPKDLYNNIVMVDAGHGGSDPGACYNGVKEKNINFKLQNYFKQAINKDTNIKYYYTRNEDVFYELYDRTEMANDLQADFIISMHNNATKNKDTSVRGTLIFKTDNQATSKLEEEMANEFENSISKVDGNIMKGKRNSNMLFLLRNSQMPSVLIEYGFLTNKEDVELLKNEEVLIEYANKTAEVIEKYFE